MKLASLVRLTVAAVVVPLWALAATSAFAASQSITFPPITTFVWKGGSATLAATASSGLPITYSVASGPCAIAGTFLTAKGAGDCTVNANQAGDANFTAAPTVTNSVTVLKAPQTVVVSVPLSIPYYSTASGVIPLTVTGSGSGFVDGRRDDDSAPCIFFNINGDFRLYGTRVGTCSLYFFQLGNDDYLASPRVDVSIAITIGSQFIAFQPLRDRVLGELPFDIAVTPSSLPSGVYATANSLTPAVCTVATIWPPFPAQPIIGPRPPRYEVTLISTGVCRIVATQDGNVNFLPASPVERRFNITKAGIAPREFTLAPNIINPRAGTPITLTALIRGAAPNGVVSFTTTQVSEITNPTVPIVGCTNLSVSLLPAVTDSAVATCTTIAEAGAHRYTASYSNDALNQVKPVTITANSPAAGPIDYSDIWWGGAAESGWGMTIAQKGLQQFNAFYVYDADGKPVWYVMSGGSWNADFTRFSGAIYQPTGSSFMNYDARRLQVGAARGNSTITFTDANNAVFNYTLNGLTAQKNISRLKFGVPDTAPKINVKDIWWAGGNGNEIENGWGVSISQQDRSLFASWYTYGADGKATWLVMSGGAWTGTTYTGELYTTTSSPWLGVAYDGAKFRTQLVGSVTFGFSDAGNATMTYTVNGVTQSKVIQRLVF